MINFSFIIPHKNLPDLLTRCVKSIPDRDDVEVIIVDDNSDPEKVDFDNFPGKDRKNIKLIFDKEAKGAGAARNIGIKAASGKWLLFADSDDSYTDQLNSFLDNYEDSQADAIYFKCEVIAGTSYRKVIPNMNLFIDAYFKGNGSIDDIKFGAWEPWNKMIKRSVVTANDLRFDEISSSNDKMFSLNLGRYVKTVEVSSKRIYNYILRQDSIIHHSSRTRFSDAFYTVLRQNALYHKVGYPRKTFVPYFLLQNTKFVTKKDVKKYFQYLKEYKTHPMEGFIKNFLFLVFRKIQ